MSDLIRREDAIKAIWGDDINPSEDGMVFEAQSHIDRDIRLIPSADRPQGEWMDRGMRVPCSWVKKCSLCGHETDTWRWCKFCPNCGAKMVNGEGGE